MDKKKYDWAAYYLEACEREKKKTESLMDQLYAEEKNRDALQAKYDKITGGIAWRCLDGLRAVRNVCRRLTGADRLADIDDADGQGAAGDSDAVFRRQQPERYREILTAYQQELTRQMDPYDEWFAGKAQTLREQALKTCPVSAQEAAEQCRIVPYQEIGAVLDRLQTAGGTEAWPELLLFAEDPACLSEDAPRLALAAVRAHPDAVFWYGDEDLAAEDADGVCRHQWPYLKPDWSPETLAGFFYFGSYVGIRSEALRAGALQYEQGTPRNVLYSLCLFLTWKALFAAERAAWRDLACHTELVLYTGWKVPPKRPNVPGIFENTNSEDYRLCENYWGYEPCYAHMKQKLLGAAAACDCVSGTTALADVESLYLVRSPEAMPVVSVVIPSKDHYDVLQTCISSFLEKTEYPEKKVEFIVVDNGSDEVNRSRTEVLLAQIREHPLVCRTAYVYEKAPFNFSAMCNAGAKAAQGELLLLLNDDIEILVYDWLKLLVGQTFLPGTGAVGAKLWYPACEKIQHAGITNLAIGPSHKLITFPEDRLYYYGHGAVCMNMMAVTAACLLVQRSVYEELGGLNEELAVAYNDVEFCFRLLHNGYRNVQRNDAVLLHHESLSRGRDDASDEKWDRLYAERRKLYELYPDYERFDPYYSRYLIQDLAEYNFADADPYAERLRVTACAKTVQQAELQPAESDRLQLTVDRVLIQRKFHMEEPDILMAEGWCYLPGADNALYEPFLTLRAQDGTVYEYPVQAKYRYDVCAILSHEQHVGLAGFVCRVMRQDLAAGTYQAGLLYRHRGTGEELWAESAQAVEVL